MVTFAMPTGPDGDDQVWNLQGLAYLCFFLTCIELPPGDTVAEQLRGAKRPSTSTAAFVPPEFDVPTSFHGTGFRFEPLGPEHNERDHAAWSSSIDHIEATPGFNDPNWPRPMSLGENLSDLVGHADDFAARRGFTYSILDGDDVVGCLYIYPSSDEGVDACVSSWVTEARAELDGPTSQAIGAWLEDDWPFASTDYVVR